MSSTIPAARIPARAFRLAGVLLAASILSGCGSLKRDHVEVGAVPDDYRTNHPIVISEQEQVIDIPVGIADERLSASQKIAVRGFMADYDRASAPVVQILHPSGSANERAAADLSGEMVALIAGAGVPKHKIVAVPYHVAEADAAAPIRLSYNRMTASTGPCGRWPADILSDSENRHYANFGCSMQNNLAAQIADPADLLGPRKPTEINAERRGVAIGDYQADELVFPTETEY
jgi:pilus assembly protein CpaD